MAPPTTSLLERAEERLRTDPTFATVLATVLDEPPRSSGDTEQRVVARAINTARQATRRHDFRAGSLSTNEVQQVLGLKTPQAVHGRRTRGTLLGVRLGDQTWFPAWQFDLEHGRTRPELRRVIHLLRSFTDDTITADRIMRQHHDELDGSIEDALRRGDPYASTAWNILRDLGA